MKKILYFIFLLLSLVSCGTGDKCFLSPEFEEVRSLMQTDPQTALQKLQELPPSSSSTLYNYEYTILLAEALYKNYLPQSNFDEFKAIVESLESEENTSFRLRQAQPPTPNSSFRLRQAQPAIPNYLIAKAHYYHAVGLNEHDDIVGSCEHYLKALEIMLKQNIELKTQVKGFDHEKVKFIVLIYNRLGELFLANTHTDLALVNFKHALRYTEILNDTFSKAIILKLIGNTYQVSGNADSALYYYNKSLQTNSHPSNKLNIDKSIALILFNNGDKDSAYALIYNYNLNKIKNINVKYAYHYTLGDMLYQDAKYDSAIYYLETSLNDSIFYNKLSFTLKLAEIYNAIGNYEKKSFYDNLSSKLSVQRINKSFDISRLQTIYDEYKEKKYERQKNTINTKIIILIILSTLTIIILTSIVISTHHHNKKQLQIKMIDIEDKDVIIEQIEKENIDIRHKYSLIEGKIKSKDTELKEKDKTIKIYQQENTQMKDFLGKEKLAINLKKYYQCDICAKIFKDIDDLSDSGINNDKLKPLSQYELCSLLDAANLYLNNYINNTSLKYPDLKRNDLYYICLSFLNLNDKQISALLGITYSAVRKKRKKIYEKLNKNETA